MSVKQHFVSFDCGAWLTSGDPEILKLRSDGGIEMYVCIIIIVLPRFVFPSNICPMTTILKHENLAQDISLELGLEIGSGLLVEPEHSETKSKTWVIGIELVSISRLSGAYS